jgi:cytochrome c
MRRFGCRAAAAILLVMSIPGDPAHAHTAAEAQALVERGVAHLRAVGRNKAFADFNRGDGGYVDGELYIFCLDRNGIAVAHGGNPKMVGRGMPDVRGSSGQPIASEIVSLGLTQGQGWIHYSWPNPSTKRVEPKSTYVIKVDNETVCASGYYQGVPP